MSTLESYWVPTIPNNMGRDMSIRMIENTLQATEPVSK